VAEVAVGMRGTSAVGTGVPVKAAPQAASPVANINSTQFRKLRAIVR
jgi:hypothetical protein